ncbi:MAG: WG repeat-containing protein [Flavobacteriales bacterium]|nr:WG repeat-containing protein [Flavobacteriales bacterium]
MAFAHMDTPSTAGFARVTTGTGATHAEGIIDRDGNVVIPPRTDMLVNNITGARALVQRGRAFLFIDLDSPGLDPALLDTEAGYSYAEPFASGRALVHLEDAIFYIDTAGQRLFGTTYTHAESFHHDRALVFLGERKHIIDPEGRIVAELPYDQVNPYSPWCWQVTNVKGDVYLSGFVDLNGKETVPLIYDDVLYFDPEEDRTRAGIKDKFGYLDAYGNAVIPVQYDYAEIFRKGKARVAINGRDFFIDRNGNEVPE